MSRRRDDLPGARTGARKSAGRPPGSPLHVGAGNAPARGAPSRARARTRASRQHQGDRQGRPYMDGRGSPPPLRLISGIMGGVLLVAGIIWFGWLLTHQSSRIVLPTLPLPGLAPTQPSAVQIPPLLAAGITLGKPAGRPAVSQQQALLIASQLEPDAAAHAKSVNAQYVLLNYSSTGTPATHPDWNNYPAWMVLYQNIPLQPNDASVDPTPFPQSHHDLYVFLDASTGKELLAIWV